MLADRVQFFTESVIREMTREALKDITMGVKEKDRAKNMFVLGFLYWMYNRELDNTIGFIREKFGKKPEIYESNVKALQAGYNYVDTTETFTTRYKVEKAKMDPGTYRSIMGNQALAYGLIAASQKSGLQLFLGSYPITPASDILHELSKYKNFAIKTLRDLYRGLRTRQDPELSRSHWSKPCRP